MAELSSKVQVDVLTKSDTDGVDEAGKKIGLFSKNVQDAAHTIGKAMVGMGIAATGILLVAGKSAVDFEDSLANVRKTAGLTSAETDLLGKSILEMSKNTRTSIADLTDIGRVGGQIGIAKDQLESFIKSIDQASVALGDEFTGGGLS